ncbi:MAG: OmpA family protein [Bacteroidota bacterium]
MDIYYVDFENGKWGEPTNAGTKVNTSYDEVFPFIHNSGVLFFSSDNLGGEGGFDIYRLMPDRAFPFALSMGYPFNSSGDDLGFIANDKGDGGFFTSARSGSLGKDNIYAFDAPDGIDGLPQPEEFLGTNFHVYNALTNAPIPNAGLFLFSSSQKENLEALYDVDITQFDNDELGLKITLSSKGMNTLPNLYSDSRGDAYAKIAKNRQFYLLARKEGFEPKEVTFGTFDGVDKNGIGVAMYPVPIIEEVNESVTTTALVEKGVTLVASKIFYDFDKSYIRVGAARDLDALIILMNKYPEVEVDLIAHTDARGARSYNQKLSEQRAISAKNYLIANGINSNRIRTFGKGESTPRNGCTDGVNCTETEHQYNRRTEIIIRKSSTAPRFEMIDNAPEKIDAMRK